MIDGIEITKDLRGSFERILRRIPKKLRKNSHILETTVAYLKMGGEKLARQSVEVFRAIDVLETAQRKRKLRNEALLRVAEAREIEAATEGDTSPESNNIIRYR